MTLQHTGLNRIKIAKNGHLHRVGVRSFLTYILLCRYLVIKGNAQNLYAECKANKHKENFLVDISTKYQSTRLVDALVKG